MEPVIVHVHVHNDGGAETAELLHDIRRSLRRIETYEVNMTIQTQELLEVVNDVDTVGDSIIALLENLSAQIADEPRAQAAIDEAVRTLRTERQAIADAVLANTPAAPSEPTGETPDPGTTDPADPGTTEPEGDGTVDPGTVDPDGAPADVPGEDAQPQ